MTSYVLRRLANIALVLLGMTLFVFVLLRVAPGSPVAFLLGEDATVEAVAELEREMGLDQPFIIQYFRYMTDLASGDFGVSHIYSTDAFRLVAARFPATIELTLAATTLTALVAIPLGIVIAVWRNSWIDYVGSLFGILGVSVPAFWLGFMLILLFAVNLGWVATSGRGPSLVTAFAAMAQGDFAPLQASFRYLILPTVTLASFQLAFVSRMTRSSILEEMSQNYVRAARARGLPRYFVIGKHALRNALLPVVTVLGLEIGSLIGGAIIAEVVFAWPGVGHLIYEAVTARDYPLAQAGILMIGVGVVVVTFAVDLLYGVIDPRVRYR